MNQIDQGVYASIPYIVFRKDDGKLYIGLDSDVSMRLAAGGANLHLLDDIGDQNPDDAMAAMLESLPEKAP